MMKENTVTCKANLPKRVPSTRGAAVSIFITLLTLMACVPSPAAPSAAPLSIGTPVAPQERVPFERLFPPTQAPTTSVLDRQREQKVVQSFAKSAQDIDKRWQSLHSEYDTWKRGEATCTRAAVNKDLEGFVADFSQVKGALNSLSRHSNVRGISELLNDAAEAEHRALRRLSSGWRPGDSAIFEVVEEAKVSSDKVRRNAADSLQDLLARATKTTETPTPTPAPGTPPPFARAGSPTPEPLDLQVIKDFASSVEKAQALWDEFRKKYDQWRQKGGNCNREAVNAQLAKVATALAEIRGQVNALERDFLVRPMREQLIEAVQKDDEALRALRQAWEPYDTAQYDRFEAQRNEVVKLRRQALDGLQDLLNKYSPSGS